MNCRQCDLVIVSSCSTVPDQAGVVEIVKDMPHLKMERLSDENKERGSRRLADESPSADKEAEAQGMPTFHERSDTALGCLPESPYRDALAVLFTEMHQEMERLRARVAELEEEYCYEYQSGYDGKVWGTCTKEHYERFLSNPELFGQGGYMVRRAAVPLKTKSSAE